MSAPGRDPLERVLEEAADHLRRGERPSASEYAEKYPHLADAIRSLFPLLIRVEGLALPLGALSSTVEGKPGSPEPTDVPVIPGYEVLSELGRGGMGVVFKARQLALNRVVALKMIRPRGGADADELALFRREAEAAARLQHPGIAQIHEIGDHDGRPYLALEFVEGGTLAGRLSGVPLEPAEAARLGELLAWALQAAHEKGVVHRDLKPSNVLLTADGLPKVADFGLARLEGAESLAATGAVVGTPSYMAPEQAGGDGARVGPASDVYGLGAVLYEALTGRPPFRGPTVVDTLLQVRTQEPVPPSQMQPGVPRDLETICLKCLEKEPGKRYAAAEDLAEDLRRFRAGEPIRARRVGWGERLVKWARRRPAAAGLIVALVLGTAFSLGFGWSASRWAQTAEQNASNYRLERDRAVTKERGANTALARGLLWPLGHADGSSLSGVELKALWELARSDSKDDIVRLTFVEQALQSPDEARQLRVRRTWALHAAVGLDPGRRRRVEGLLLAKVGDEKADFLVRVDAAVIGLALDEPGPDLAEVAIPLLLQASANETARTHLGQTVLAAELRAAGQRLDAGRARRVALALLDVDPKLARSAGDLQGIAVPADRLDAEGAETVVRVLCERIRAVKPEEAEVRVRTQQVLGPVVSRLEGSARLAAARVLRHALQDSSDPSVLAVLLSVALILIDRLPADEDAALAEMAAGKALETHRANSGKPGWHDGMAPTLEALAPRLSPTTARAAANALADTVERLSQQGIQPLARAVMALGTRLEPAESRRLAARLNRALAERGKALSAPVPADADVISLTLDLQDYVQTAKVLAPAIAPEPVRDHAALGTRRLEELLTKVPPAAHTTQTLTFLAEAARLLGDLDPDRAAVPAGAVARHVMDKLKADPNLEARYALAEMVGTVAGRLDSQTARKVALAVLDLFRSEWGVLEVLAKILPALVSRLDAEGCGAVAPVLADVLGTTSYTHLGLVDELERVLAKSDSAAARKALEALQARDVAALPNRSDKVLLEQFLRAHRAAASRLDAADARAVTRTVFDGLPRQIFDDQDPIVRCRLEVLRSATGRLDADGRKAWTTLLGAEVEKLLRSGEEGRERQFVVAQVLEATAANLDAEGLTVAVAFMKKTSEITCLWALARAVQAGADRLEGAHAAAAAQALAEATGRTGAHGAPLILALVAVAKRVDRAKAVEHHRSASRLLLRLLPEVADGETLGPLAVAAEAVLPLLAADDARELRQALSRAVDRVARDEQPLNVAPLAAAPPVVFEHLQADAARVLARTLIDKGQMPPAPLSFDVTVTGVLRAAERLPPEEGNRLVSEAVLRFFTGWTPEGLHNRPPADVAALAAALPRLDDATARLVAGQLMDWLAGVQGEPQGWLIGLLWLVCRRHESAEVPRQASDVAALVAGSGSPTVGIVADVWRLARPRPGRFSAQELVDLLKRPTCVGPARAVVLEHLGLSCGRRFASLTEFVTWAAERRPDLDLTTAPRG